MLTRSKVAGVASLIVLLFASVVNAQSKLYVSGAIADVFGFGSNLFLGSYKEGFLYRAYDLEYQRPLIGSFHLLTGVSYFTSGYETTDASFSSSSDLDLSFVGVPIMSRWNVGNKNMFYLDVGFFPYYLVKAHLTEGINKFGSPVTVEGDITQYSNRLYAGLKFQMLILVNRFHFGVYFMAPTKGQSTLKGLEDHWGLNAQQSTYLLSNGFSDYMITGLKLGIRIL